LSELTLAGQLLIKMINFSRKVSCTTTVGTWIDVATLTAISEIFTSTHDECVAFPVPYAYYTPSVVTFSFRSR